MRKSLFLKLFLTTMLCVPVAVMAQVTIGSLEDPEKAALLDLKSHVPDANNVTSEEGGLLLPRVALENLTTLAPFINNATNDEKLSHTGLTVYNVKNDNTADLIPGFYYWNGEEWLKTLSEIPSNTVNMRNLVADAISVTGTASDANGAVLNFGTVTFPEDGAYAFSFRLYGNVRNANLTGNLPLDELCCYYLKAYIGTTLVDAAELNLYTIIAAAINVHTYSVILAVDNALKGQTVTFRLCHHTSFPRSWTLIAAAAGTPMQSHRTSMVWWKI